MKVFISWSGERSHLVAQLLNDWLPTVTDKVLPWLSSSDIESGAQWFSEITQSLADTTQGIFCLTHENVNAPWVLFEAGAIAKGINKSRVYTFLVDLGIQDVKDPLAQFNHTLPAAEAPKNKESVYKLVKSINDSQGPEKLREDILDAVFESKWPNFEIRFKEIINSTNSKTALPPPRNSSELTKDILEIVRGIDKQVNEIRNYPDGLLQSQEAENILREQLLLPWVRNPLINLFKQSNFSHSLTDEELSPFVDFFLKHNNPHPSIGINRNLVKKVIGSIYKEWYYYRANPDTI